MSDNWILPITREYSDVYQSWWIVFKLYSSDGQTDIESLRDSEDIVRAGVCVQLARRPKSVRR